MVSSVGIKINDSLVSRSCIHLLSDTKATAVSRVLHKHISYAKGNYDINEYKSQLLDQINSYQQENIYYESSRAINSNM